MDGSLVTVTTSDLDKSNLGYIFHHRVVSQNATHDTFIERELKFHNEIDKLYWYHAVDQRHISRTTDLESWLLNDGATYQRSTGVDILRLFNNSPFIRSDNDILELTTKYTRAVTPTNKRRTQANAIIEEYTLFKLQVLHPLFISQWTPTMKRLLPGYRRTFTALLLLQKHTEPLQSLPYELMMHIFYFLL